MLLFVGEGDNLGFDAGAIARTDTLNLSVEQGRIRQPFAQNPVHFFVGIAGPALQLLQMARTGIHE